MLPRLTLAHRLWLPTIVLALVSVLLAGVAIDQAGTMQARTAALQERQQNKLELSLRWAGLTETNAARVVAGLMSADANTAALLKPQIEATSARISEIQKQVEALSTDDDEKAAMASVAARRKDYIEARGQATKLKAAGETAAALAAMTGSVQPAVAGYLAAQQAFVDVEHGKLAALREAAGQERIGMVWSMAGVMAAVVLLLSVSTLFMVRSIRRPLDEVVRLTARIGQGDLSVSFDDTRHDEIGKVQNALREMCESLRALVSQVRSSADNISNASTEIAHGNEDLSRRTEQTASNLQQTASSMEELTGTVRQSADSARTANQLASSATAVAQRGGEVVSKVVATMDDINSSSKKIADIIGTIDGIAFQTNILALNAAVEAARAGEQGRGFAVVAGEVRTLAQRSASAAREIKGLIGASVEKVDSGSQLVRDAGSTMQEIVASVQRVTDIIGEITAAASEQSEGIGQVNHSVTELDTMTQQNAALVEQSAAAAESLKQQAHRLSGVVSAFRLQPA
jgi:methyl-accepting chemotaxis protein